MQFIVWLSEVDLKG